MIGLDIGGTSIKGASFENFRLKKRHSLPTASASFKQTIQNIFDVIDELSSTPESIGISIAGRTDRKGVIEFNPNIPSLVGKNLKKIVQDRYQVNVSIENDALCFAYAEWKLGAAKGTKTMVGLIIGTGIGSGIIIDGAPLKGAGCAGELGHMIIDPSGIECGCGNVGDFESWCSGKNIVRHYINAGGKMPDPDPRKIYFSRDLAAVNIRRQTIEKFGIGLANIQRIFDPEVIVLGGGVSNLPFYAELEKAANSHLAKKIKLKKKKLEAPGELGAALYAQSSSSGSYSSSVFKARL